MVNPPSNNKIPRTLSPSDTSKLERDLVEGLIEKQEWAYRELVLNWSEKLFGLAFRFLQRSEEAKELVQEVFLKVVEKIHTFKGDSKLGTWLYRITVNEALMRIRSQKRDPLVEWEDFYPKYQDGIMVADISEGGDRPDLKLIEKEEREIVFECLKELPEDFRAPYLLKDVEQLSEEEASEILGISKSAMKTRVHRARLFLRKKLREKYAL